MAEFLVKAVDAHHPDPARDAVNCYKKGDPVVAMPDGHKWGSEERNPEKFAIIAVPDMTLEEARSLCVPHTEIITDPETGESRVRVLIRRRYYLNEQGVLEENQAEFYDKVLQGLPYETTRMNLLCYGLEDKVP